MCHIFLADKLKQDNFRGNLIVPPTDLTLVKKTFCFRGGESWLALPAGIRIIEKIVPFKKALKSWTQNNIKRFLD